MTRPKKAVVDYFPHYCNHGKTMFTIEQKYGNDGYAFWFKLLEILGKNENHFYDCNEPAEWEYLIATARMSEDITMDILSTLAKLNAIDAELWQKKIIWSENFINNLKDLYSRRGIEPYDKPTLKDYCMQKYPLSGIIDGKNPQSIVKDIKVKDTKGEDSTTTKIKFGDDIFCDEIAYLKLYYKFGHKLVDQKILAIVDWFYQNPKKKRGKPELSIQRWLTDDINAGKYTAKPEPKNSVILPERFVDYFNQRYEEHGYTTTLENVLEVMQQFDEIRKYIVLSRDEDRLNAELLKKARTKV
jgi:hypothetical protein